MPRILVDAGNLTVRLDPYPWVARVQTRLPGDNPETIWATAAREVQVALHLAASGVPVVSPATTLDPGPHAVGDTWMTLWPYCETAHLPPPTLEELISLVTTLTAAMARFPGPLPPLAAWQHGPAAAARLQAQADQTGDRRLDGLLAIFWDADRWIRTEALEPCHGDAHPGNLLPTADGWRWIDFEDASLMPRHWDLAALVARHALLDPDGLRWFQEVLNILPSAERPAFRRLVVARAVLSTVVAVDLAWQGLSDRHRATAQLSRIPALVDEIGP